MKAPGVRGTWTAGYGTGLQQVCSEISLQDKTPRQGVPDPKLIASSPNSRGEETK